MTINYGASVLQAYMIHNYVWFSIHINSRFGKYSTEHFDDAFSVT